MGNLIKNKNNFVLGIILIVMGLFLLTSDSIVNTVTTNSAGGLFARADIYIRSLAAILCIVSVLMIALSINWKKEQDVPKFVFVLTKEMVITAVALILYTYLLPIVGFGATTFTLIAGLTIVYGLKETSHDDVEFKVRLRKCIISGLVYSTVLTVILYLAFTYLLKVILP